jgi:hypothetical protein
MKRVGLVAMICAALAAARGTAFGQGPPCPDSFDGLTAKQLSACISSLQNSIAELKSKPALGILAVGFVDPTNTNAATLSGSIKVTVKKLPGTTGVYEMIYVPAQTKPPIVLVGPKSEDLTNVALTSSNEVGFDVTTRDKNGAAWIGFWFAIFSHD